MKNNNGTSTWFGTVESVECKTVEEIGDFSVVAVSSRFVRETLQRKCLYLVIQGHHSLQTGEVLEITEMRFAGDTISEVLSVTSKTSGKVVQRKAHQRPFAYIVCHDVDACAEMSDSSLSCTDPGHFFLMKKEEIEAYFSQNPWRGYDLTGWGEVHYPVEICAGFQYWQYFASPMGQMHYKVMKMSDQDLITIWGALGEQKWSGADMWGEGVSMDVWAHSIYSELTRRGYTLDWK